MSKESKSRDRWRQHGQSDYSDWCAGCGLYAWVHDGVHREDCTRGMHGRRSDNAET